MTSVFTANQIIPPFHIPEGPRQLLRPRHTENHPIGSAVGLKRKTLQRGVLLETNAEGEEKRCIKLIYFNEVILLRSFLPCHINTRWEETGNIDVTSKNEKFCFIVISTCHIKTKQNHHFPSCGWPRI